jgi:hypothetical protein
MKHVHIYTNIYTHKTHTHTHTHKHTIPIVRNSHDISALQPPAYQNQRRAHRCALFSSREQVRRGKSVTSARRDHAQWQHTSNTLATH